MVDFSKYLKENKNMAKRNPTEAELDAVSAGATSVDAPETDIDSGELVIDLPADFAEQMELANKPPLEPGKYLATIQNVLPKVTDKGTHASRGLNWTLLINSDPEAVVNGWNPDAKSISYTHYTYIGKIVDGKLTDTDKGGATRDMGSALGLTGSFVLSAVKNRQIIVNVKLKPSQEDEAAQRQDPTHEVERWYDSVNYVKPYIVNGIRGPVNEFLSDGSDSGAPAW